MTYGFGQGFDDYRHQNKRPSTEYSRMVQRWLDERSGENPWFIYVHAMDPNAPYGRRVKPVVQHIDLMPTILDYVGLEIPPAVQGRSLLGQARFEGEIFSHLAAAEPQRVARMNDLLEAKLRRESEAIAVKEIPLTEELQEELEALGYLQ